MSILSITVAGAYRLYCSKFSKKLGIYQNQRIIKIKNKTKICYFKLKSRKIRELYYSDDIFNTIDLAKLTYSDLNCLKEYNIKLFKKISELIYSTNVNTIKRKTKIRVAFYLYAAGLWSCDKLYKLLEKDNIFEPYIIVTRFNNGTPSSTLEEYTNTVDILQKKGYHVIGVSDHYSKYNNWFEAGNPDLVILLTPYSGANPKEFDLLSIPLSTLLFYIPYALGGNGYIDSLGKQLCWKETLATSDELETKKEYSLLGTNKVILAGHPKIDALLMPEIQYNAENIWKFTPGINHSIVKKIIYAPHFSIFDTTIRIGTFNQNCHDIFEFAKLHPETSWIIKPHQNLRSSTVKTGFFKSEKEYDEYMAKWDALPNAKTILHGTYDDIFLTSDAMIMDCDSFLVEYTILNKPLIFLRRPEQVFNRCGNKILKCVYSVDGKNIPAIYDTLTNVALNGNDSLLEKRKKLVDELTEVYRTFENCTTSSEYIYQYLKKELR